MADKVIGLSLSHGHAVPLIRGPPPARSITGVEALRQGAGRMHGNFGCTARASLHNQRRSVLELLPTETGHTGWFLVCEREDDCEGDHHKGDRISIQSFPVDVNTHRTALLFREVTAKTINLGCCSSNSLPAMLKAQQHFRCGARVQSKPHLSKRPTVG
jgi:hypothetical protein